MARLKGFISRKNLCPEEALWLDVIRIALHDADAALYPRPLHSQFNSRLDYSRARKSWNVNVQPRYVRQLDARFWFNSGEWLLVIPPLKSTIVDNLLNLLTRRNWYQPNTQQPIKRRSTHRIPIPSEDAYETPNPTFR